MYNRFENEKKKRLSAVRKQLAGRPKSKDLIAFADHFYKHAAAEDLTAYSADFLCEMVAHSFKLLGQRKADTAEVRIRNADPQTEGARPVTIIEVLSANRPFVFDSILGEVQAAGYRILFVVHPIFAVERTPGGKLKEFQSSKKASKENRTTESFIQIHVPQIHSEADRDKLKEDLLSLCSDVKHATSDWHAMRARLSSAIDHLRKSEQSDKSGQVEEAIAFLEWLEDDNFTFVGMREYSYSNVGKGQAPKSEGEGLGLLHDPDFKILRRGQEMVAITPEIRAFLMSTDPLIITKANVRSRIHRRDYMDYVGVKIFNKAGRVTGELRAVGLFTSTAFTRSVLRIPLIRMKVKAVLDKAGFDPVSHSGKALLNILEGYPRIELFQADEASLLEAAMSVLLLQERPRVRAIIRRDKFDRFVSALVFVPRERYSSSVRERIGETLAEMFGGHISNFFPDFPEGGLARVQFIIGLDGDATAEPDQADIEARLRAIVRTWEDELVDTIAAVFPPDEARFLVDTYQSAFNATFQAAFDVEAAIETMRIAEDLVSEEAISARFLRRPDMNSDQVLLRLYHLATPIPLSQRVPALENLGFRVINERTYSIRPAHATRLYIHDMTLAAGMLASNADDLVDLEANAPRLEDAVQAVWHGQAENDGFNALVLTAGLDWRKAAILRTIGRYLRQAQIPYSLDYVWDTLNRHPDIASCLVELFEARFNPGLASNDKAQARAERVLEEALSEVSSLDDDTILRYFSETVLAAQRTDFYAGDNDGSDAADGSGDLPSAITLKLDPKALSYLPAPRPYREIWVHSPEVEGVHMRFGPIARGGLRWSDRPQDFRVEVLGLVKAQQVKNAVIVPVGSKGGFFPKNLPTEGGREAVFNAGRQAYISFIDRLLSVTDNLDGDVIEPPENVIRHDGDDPYLVVAADKGTATFSDTANAVSEDHGFWLGDAFASGGSAGYDHKVMGITARGAWEAVQRHFREMNIDIQTEPFDVVGVGDMSGDVFGNGMLLSEKIRLVAAFNHMHIFLDPDPDIASSFAERQRLFQMGRSTWEDYNASLISKGGGIFSRQAKQIELSNEARKLLGIRAKSVRPNEVITAILKAESDLLWFGGIGTYVRAPFESNADVGDKANDAIRITSDEVGAKVVGEGANLGMTQPARISYSLQGGRCNSDAIDNSAGVNSSDVEVNIKIALASAVRSKSLTMPARNKLLAKMTEDVASLVLRNNYQQTLSISLDEMRGLEMTGNHSRLMADLEGRDLLDRAVEDLPDAVALSERIVAGQPLTRPEIGVLLAYAKIVLLDDLVASDVPDDPYLERELFRYFPAAMQKKFSENIKTHRLRREIIATQLANSLINRGGSTVLVQMNDRTGHPPSSIARAYTAVRDSFQLQELHGLVDALDNKMDGRAQAGLYLAIQDVLIDRLGWFLRNVDLSAGLETIVTHYQKCLALLDGMLPELLPPFLAETVKTNEKKLVGKKVPAQLAARLARLPHLAAATDIVLIAEHTGHKLRDAAIAYYAIGDRFRFGRIAAMTEALESSDYYESLAIGKAADNLASAQRALSERVLSHPGPKPDLGKWEANTGGHIAQTVDQIETLLQDGVPTAAKAIVASSLLAELAHRR